MKKLLIFTGAGVSAESGIPTFRSSNGLWANYRIEDICTAEAMERNRPTVIRFYNERRREMLSCEPNDAHRIIAELEKDFDLQVVTQNVDNLHERAGSTRITHLHGELTKLRSTINPDLIVPIEGWEQKLDAIGPDGALLRPHIVFFGEAVPMFDHATRLAREADILVVIGTSLVVYPAAYLVQYVRPGVPIYIIDPGTPDISHIRNNPVTVIQKTASEGMRELAKQFSIHHS